MIIARMIRSSRKCIRKKPARCIQKNLKNVCYSCCQSNLHKTTTFGTTQKWSSWTGGRLIKHLYKMTTKKSGCSWQVFSFYSHCECFINNKDLQFCVFWCHSWRKKMFLVTIDFEHTYIEKWCYASGVYK